MLVVRSICCISGVPRAVFSEKFLIGGWGRAESQNSVIVYNCVEDVMEFFEIESFIFYKVPLDMFGFGLAELYGRLISLLRAKSLYMIRFVY